jgi:hypothetical protein
MRKAKGQVGSLKESDDDDKDELKDDDECQDNDTEQDEDVVEEADEEVDELAPSLLRAVRHPTAAGDGGEDTSKEGTTCPLHTWCTTTVHCCAAPVGSVNIMVACTAALHP